RPRISPSSPTISVRKRGPTLSSRRPRNISLSCGLRQPSSAARALRPLAVTMGEPAGIGPDLILQLYADRQSLGLPVFAVYGHADFLAVRAARLGLDIAIEAVSPDAAGETFSRALPVIAVAGDVADTPAAPDPNTAPVVVGA